MPFTERIVKWTVPSIRMDRGRDGRTTQASDRHRPNKILIGHVRLMDRGRQGGMIHPFECHWRIVKETLRSMTGDGTNGWVMPSSVFDRTNPKIIRSISHMWSRERMNVAYKADWTASKSKRKNHKMNRSFSDRWRCGRVLWILMTQDKTDGWKMPDNVIDHTKC